MNTKTVYYEITNRCNFNCTTCYNRSGLNKITKEISLDTIKESMENFRTLGANRFLFSGGEPSLHSEFESLLDLISEYKDYSFGFVTNGSSRNKKFIELLKTHDNITLQISLDGSCEEENSKTRGAGNFEKVVNFVRETYNPHRQTRLKMVISKNNYDDIEDFYGLAISLGCIPEFAFIFRSGNGVESWDQKGLSPQEKLKALTMIDALNKKFGIDAFLPRSSLSCPFITGNDKMSLCVKVDGKIQPCQTFYTDRFSLGNIYNFDKDGIIKNSLMIVDLAKKRASLDFGCSRCVINEICQRGCMAEALTISGDPLGNDQSCMFRKLEFLNFNIKNTLGKTK